MKIATKYPKSSIRFMESIGIQSEIIYLHGAQEIAPLLGLSDAIIDLVETGNTLKENGLHEIQVIREISTRLIVNKAALKTKSALINEILEIFKVSGAGKVAGLKITEGEITSTSDVRIIRDGAIIYTGKVGSIFREKNKVKQVSDGQECGITVKDYMDFQKNDTIEAFSVTSTERSI